MEDVNLLSSKRKNQLLGRAFKEANAEKGIEAETSLTWTLDSGKIDENTDLLITLDTMEGDETVTYQIENNTSDKTKLYKTKKGDEAIAADECGSVDFAKGQITLTISSVPQIEGRDNIFVTFECAVEGYVDRIKNCSFGILFGVNGIPIGIFKRQSRLRQCGLLFGGGGLTYFSDRNNTIIGSDSSAIMGLCKALG